MSSRYVWSKYNRVVTSSTTTYQWKKCNVSTSTTTNVVDKEGQWRCKTTGSGSDYFKVCWINESGTKYKPSEVADRLANGYTGWYGYDDLVSTNGNEIEWYYFVSSSTTASYLYLNYSKYKENVSTEIAGSFIEYVTSTNSSAYPNNGKYGSYWYVYNTSSTSYTYGQGSTNYGYVTNSSSSGYPSNNYSDSYWYVYQGSDSIDPISITIPPEIKSGDTIAAALTARANTYGGTITYTYSYSVDGGSTWVTAGSTTATSLAITVPKDAEQFQVRAVAADNYGFTSTTYVTSNEAVVLSGTNFTVGVDGVLRELSELDTCVGSVIRPLAHAAVSVDGVLREIF